jgi:uncharacterized protein (TIGR02594 family)
MFKLPALRRLIAVSAIIACSLVVALISTTSAEARSRHRGYHNHSHYSHHHHHAGRHHHARRHHGYRRHKAYRSRHHWRGKRARIERAANSYASLMPQDGMSSQTPQSVAFAANHAGSGSSLVAEARRYLGGNPTGRSSLWCARFMNMILARSGHSTTGSDMARSFASYGRRVSGPQVGAIAVMTRGKRGGHVGVVSGVDARGNPIVVSGNHSRRVAEATYSRSRVYAYVMPN